MKCVLEVNLPHDYGNKVAKYLKKKFKRYNTSKRDNFDMGQKRPEHPG